VLVRAVVLVLVEPESAELLLFVLVREVTRGAGVGTEGGASSSRVCSVTTWR